MSQVIPKCFETENIYAVIKLPPQLKKLTSFLKKQNVL